MKKNFNKMLILVLMITLLTGCTAPLYKDKKEKKEPVTVEGVTLTANILCQPTNKEVIKQYEQYKPIDKDGNEIEYTSLPKCNEYKITTGGYEGLWTTLFVKPLAWFIAQINKLLQNIGLDGGLASGLSLILATLIIRLILLPFTKKTAMQSELLKQAQPELQKIEKKYANAQDKETMMKKSQETMVIYKKYGINPMSSCLFAFIQIPLLIAFLEAINRLPILFEGKFLGLKLGTTPMYGITHDSIVYIILVILIGSATFFSFKLNSGATQPEMEKQMKIMSIVMMVIIIISSLNFSTALSVYWITSSTITIIQNLIVKKRRNK